MPSGQRGRSPAFAFPHAIGVSLSFFEWLLHVTELSVRSHLKPRAMAKGLAAATQAVVQRLMGENPDVTLMTIDGDTDAAVLGADVEQVLCPP